MNPALWKTGTQEGLVSQWCNLLFPFPAPFGGCERGYATFGEHHTGELERGLQDSLQPFRPLVRETIGQGCITS